MRVFRKIKQLSPNSSFGLISVKKLQIRKFKSNLFSISKDPTFRELLEKILFRNYPCPF